MELSTMDPSRTRRAELALLADQMRELEIQGYQPVTVFNLNYFELRPNGHSSQHVIPKREKGAKFSRYVIDKPKAYFRDVQGSDIMQPVTVLPIVLGRDIAQQFSEFGGIIVVAGDVAEPTPAQYAPAEEARLGAMGRRVRRAMVDWNRTHNSALIDDHQRAFAVEMHGLNILPELPGFCTIMKGATGMKECHWCTTMIREHAKVCAHCGRSQPGFEAEAAAALGGRPSAPVPQAQSGAPRSKDDNDFDEIVHGSGVRQRGK